MYIDSFLEGIIVTHLSYAILFIGMMIYQYSKRKHKGS